MHQEDNTDIKWDMYSKWTIYINASSGPHARTYIKMITQASMQASSGVCASACDNRQSIVMHEQGTRGLRATTGANGLRASA